MRRIGLVGAIVCGAVLCGCSHVMEPARGPPVLSATSGTDPGANSPVVRVQLTDGTVLFGPLDEDRCDLDSGFSIPPIPWTRIASVHRTGDVLRVSLVDGSVLEGRRRRNTLRVFTAVGPFRLQDDMISGVSCATADPREIYKDRLILCLPFDEPRGPRLRDASAQGLLGEMRVARLIPNGRYGGALAIDLLGPHACAVVPDHPALDAPLRSGLVTIAFWVRFDDPSAEELCVVSKNNWKVDESPMVRRGWSGHAAFDPERPPFSYELHIRGGQCTCFTWGIGYEWSTSIDRRGRPVASGGWTHVAVTADYWANRCAFYIDGRPSNVEPSRPLRSIRIPFISSDLLIGRVSAEGPRQMSGGPRDPIRCPATLDEFTVFNRVLSPAEIEALAQSPFAPSSTLAAFDRAASDDDAVLVDTADGSTFRGCLQMSEFRMETACAGTVRIPVTNMVRLTRDTGSRGDRLVCRSGDVLQGHCELATLPMKTGMGVVTIPWDDVKVIARKGWPDPRAYSDPAVPPAAASSSRRHAAPIPGRTP